MGTHAANTRRGFISAVGTAVAAIVAPAIYKQLSQRSFIRIQDALAEIKIDPKVMLDDSDGKFDQRVKSVLKSLNSIEGKKPNSLFVAGLSIVEQLGFHFKMVSSEANPAPTFSIDWSKKTISINKDWLNSDRKNVSEMHRVLSVIGAAFVQLKAWTPDGPPSSGQTGIERSAVSTQKDPWSLCQAIADRTAPNFVSLLVAETMLNTVPTDDLHYWHRLSNEELNPPSSFIDRFVVNNFRNVLPDLTYLQIEQEIQQLLAEKTRLLIQDLDLGDRGVGRRHSF